MTVRLQASRRALSGGAGAAASAPRPPRGRPIEMDHLHGAKLGLSSPTLVGRSRVCYPRQHLAFSRRLVLPVCTLSLGMEPHPHQRQFTGSSTHSTQSNPQPQPQPQPHPHQQHHFSHPQPQPPPPPHHAHFDHPNTQHPPSTSPSFASTPLSAHRPVTGGAVPPSSTLGNAAPVRTTDTPGGMLARAPSQEDSPSQGPSSKKPRLKGPSNSNNGNGSDKEKDKGGKKGSKDRKTRSRLACLACKSVS